MNEVQENSDDMTNEQAMLKLKYLAIYPATGTNRWSWSSPTLSNASANTSPFMSRSNPIAKTSSCPHFVTQRSVRACSHPAIVRGSGKASSIHSGTRDVQSSAGEHFSTEQFGVYLLATFTAWVSVRQVQHLQRERRICGVLYPAAQDNNHEDLHP